MIELLLILAVLCLWLFFKCYWQPWKLHQSYVRHFRNQGYRVLEVPFNPLSISTFKYYEFEGKTGDAYGLTKAHYPHHDVVVGNLLTNIFVDLIHPDLNREYLSAEKIGFYEKSRVERATFSRISKEGLGFSEGKKWKMKKKILSEVFTFEFIKSTSQRVAALCNSSLDSLEGSQGQEPEYDVLDLATHFTGNVLVDCFFGENMVNEKIEGKSVFMFAKELIGDLMLQAYSLSFQILGINFHGLGILQRDREINRRIRVFREWGRPIVRGMIKRIKEQHRRGELGSQPNNLIEAIVRESLKEKEAPNIYNDENILDEFNSFFTAGVDTTSNYLAMTIYLLAQHPRVEVKVREEIAQLMVKEDYSYEHLKQFRYIDCVQKEVTRFFGPGNGNRNRICVQDHELKGIPIHKDTYVHNQPIGIHHSDEYYSRPEEFLPERWEDECKNQAPFQLIGFSGGPRACIGKQMALLQSKIGLIKFLRRYREIALPGKKMEFILRLTYQPKNFKSRMVRSQRA